MTATCIKCGQLVKVNCTDEQLLTWHRGTLIQEAMPNVPPEEREMLITGICGTCWDSLMVEGEE